MAVQIPAPGRLIAVDGTRGADVAAEADRLARRLRARGVTCGISRWDASGVFAELLPADADDRVVSPRMLTLLYAADLVFRLRWQIQPALAAGRVVIAAPYVQSAIAVGVGLGLDNGWVSEVLRFAPAPDALRVAKERKTGRGWRPRFDRGYAEFGAALLHDTAAGLRPRKARKRAAEWLGELSQAGTASRRRAIVAQIVDERADD